MDTRSLFSRTRMLLGEEALLKLERSRVAVVGIGGVGSYTVEALARSGVGALLLVDSDTAAFSNINRQLHANVNTVGRYKTELMKERVLAINPGARVDERRVFCLPENVAEILAGEYDYIVDAVDTVSAKLALIEEAGRRNIPVISAMGAGNKLEPTMLEVADIYETSVCPLCRVMRRELKARGVKSLKVVYSRETPLKPGPPDEPEAGGKRSVPGSVAFVPSVAGLIIASEVVKDLILPREYISPIF